MPHKKKDPPFHIHLGLHKTSIVNVLTLDTESLRYRFERLRLGDDRYKRYVNTKVDLCFELNASQKERSTISYSSRSTQNIDSECSDIGHRIVEISVLKITPRRRPVQEVREHESGPMF